VGQFGAKFGEEWVDPCKPIFNTILDRHAAIVCKRNPVDSFWHLSCWHERETQTVGQTNHETVTSIAIRECK